MIHIVFQEADIEVLRKGLEPDPSVSGSIIHIKDDFAVGPLTGIYTTEGREARKQWWRDVLAGGDYDGLVDNGNINDPGTVEQLLAALDADPQEKLWIWAAQNKHDVSGYYWLMSQLKVYQGRIFILYLNNLPFINEKGHIFYPVNLFQIPHREFIKAKKLARAITSSEFESDIEEWQKLCNEDKGIRLLEGGKKLAQHDYTFYDELLLKFIEASWIKASKLINNFLQKGTHTTGDAYLLWRLKQMIKEGKLEAQGELKNMKDFEVKVPQPVPGYSNV